MLFIFILSSFGLSCNVSYFQGVFFSRGLLPYITQIAAMIETGGISDFYNINNEMKHISV